MALFGAAAILPILGVCVASILGMGIGSADNGGLGTPLSNLEVKALAQQARGNLRPDDRPDDKPLSYEEAAEEQALVDVLRGGVVRAR